MDITNKITDATVEIFSTMLMMDIVPGEPVSRENMPFSSSVTGMIGLAGLYKGVLAMHMPNQVAMKITGNFLGMDVETDGVDVFITPSGSIIYVYEKNYVQRKNVY